MLAVIPMWQVYCDGCGVSTPTDEVGAWGSASDAQTHAENCDWLYYAGKHWCLDCIQDNGHGEFVPKSSESILTTYRARLVRLLRDEAAQTSDSQWDAFADFVDNLPKRLY